MANEKPGDSVAAIVEGKNAEGQVLSRTTHEMFGFDNTGANVTAEAVVMAVFEKIGEFIDVKSNGASVELRKKGSGATTTPPRAR